MGVRLECSKLTCYWVLRSLLNVRLTALCLTLCLFFPVGSYGQSMIKSQAATEPLSSKLCSPAGTTGHEVYHLPPRLKLPADLSFATDWKEVVTGGWFGRQAMDHCRIRADGFLTWHGKVAVRVEVQPNDDPLALRANSERAEMLGMQDADGVEIRESAKTGTQYYATSYYFPDTWQGQQLPWSAFPKISCAFGSQNACNSWSFVWQFYGWGGLTAAQLDTNGPERYLFNNAPLANGGLVTLGKWTDFVFMVNWGTGEYIVWRRDEGEAKFSEVLNGRTPVRRDVYVKQGLYRGGNVAGRTDVLWIGPTVRGLSFSSVEQEAFSTGAGP